MIINNTKKFKTVTISIRFKEEIKEENVALRALLPAVMSSATSLYNTRKKLNEALENLYASGVSARTYILGKLSVLNVSLNIINPSYMEEGFFELSLKILNDLIFGHKMLPKKYFDLEKSLLLERLEELENDKTYVALERLVKNMFKGERYAIRPNSTKEDISAITYEKLNEYYFNVVNNNDYDVVISGDIDSKTKEMISKYFVGRNNYNHNPIDDEPHYTNGVKRIVEQDDINQVKLNIGYNLPIDYKDDLYTAAVLFNAIFGGYSSSRLFMIVREKHSLCYSVRSSYDAYKGFLCVYAGVPKKKVNLAKKLINEQLKDLQTNLVSDEELERTKLYFINDLKELEDSQGRWMNNIYLQKLLNKESKREEKIKVINSVTKEDILTVARMVQIDTVYMLEPEVKE
jgi:predicted Zn-dependent peptidase